MSVLTAITLTPNIVSTAHLISNLFEFLATMKVYLRSAAFSCSARSDRANDVYGVSSGVLLDLLRGFPRHDEGTAAQYVSTLSVPTK